MPTVLALSINAAMIATAHAGEIQSSATVIGAESQWWNNYTIDIANVASTSGTPGAIDMTGTTITFNSDVPLTTPAWKADGLSYPKLSFTSKASGAGYVNVLEIGFDAGSWIKTDLPEGGAITLTFGVSGQIGIDTVNQSLNVQVPSLPSGEAPTVTVSNPQAGSIYNRGDVIALAADAADKDGQVAKVEFFANAQKVGEDLTAPYTLDWTANLEGAVAITAKATDDSGMSATSAEVAISVKAVPLPPLAPEVAILSPKDGQTVFNSGAVQITANATDKNDDLKQVEFFVDGLSVGVVTQAPFVANWQPAALGQAVITVTATDAGGLSTTVNATVDVKEAGQGNLTCDIKQVYRADGSECMGDDHPRRIIGYFTSWRHGQNGLPSYLVGDLPWDKLTHINYAFASVNPTTNIIQVDDTATKMTWEGVPGAEMDPSFSYKGHFNLLSKYKKQYPDVKTLISVGGWAESRGFYSMTTDIGTCGVNMAGIETFNASAVEFIRQYGFDGVDIDYEYPTSMTGAGNPNDFDISDKCRGQLWSNYMVMMEDLRVKLDAAGKQDGRKYMLTIAAPASGYLLRGMEDMAMGDVLDYVNIMSYDLHGAWNEYVGPQAALFDDGKDGELAAAGVYSTAQYQNIGYLNVAWAYHYFRGAFNPSQINIGVPYYTRGWQGVSGGTNGMWGSSVLPAQAECQPGTGVNTPCGWGATGIDNIWHDKDAQGREMGAGSMPMWHAMNLANATKLGINVMPSYGPEWGLDANNPDHVLQGEYQRHWDDATKSAWLWNATKKVFLSIEDADSLMPKLDYIIDNGIGGMMVWEMAGDYGFDPVANEYTFGTTMTDLAYNSFLQATPMDMKHNDLPAPTQVIDLDIYTTEWPAGDQNYPINPKVVFKNNSAVAIPGGSTIEFLMPTSTGDLVSDWNGAGIKVVESGHTGSNFYATGPKKMFHKVAITLKSYNSIPAGGEFSFDMVYYVPVSQVIVSPRVVMNGQTYGIKSEFPALPEVK
ncbi:glycosyl hydrolase family 18 protein [Vibrio stylophorae]